MLEDKIRDKHAGQIGIIGYIGMAVGSTLGVLLGSGTFNCYESCYKETTIYCGDDPRDLVCSKPKGASDEECNCYCQAHFQGFMTF